MHISPFLDRKLARRFRTYDTDGNGVVDRADFASAARRLAEEFGHGPGSPARQRLEELCLELWLHLARVADAGKDAAIGEGEYKTAFAAGLLEPPESFDIGYAPLLEAIVDIADQDGDGRLTADEHVRWTGALMNLAETDAREAFRRLDTDGDGLIAESELLAAVRAYYFDDDPASSGSWLLGPLDPEP